VIELSAANNPPLTSAAAAANIHVCFIILPLSILY